MTVTVLLGFALFRSLAANVAQLIRRQELVYNIGYLQTRLRKAELRTK